MKRLFHILLILPLLMALPLRAETKIDRIWRMHEVRIGWGDQLFETLMWNNPRTIANTLPTDWTKVYHEDYHYDQHIWAEYQYRHNYWFSFGGMLDLSEVHWADVTRNGTGAEVAREGGHYFYNIILMPTVRFTYFHHDYVNLYSGAGLGLGINGGSETDAKGNHTLAGAAFQITVIGMSVNYDRWFAAVDLGGLYSLQNANTIFLASSRIFSFSIGARF